MAFINDSMRSALASQLKIRIQDMVLTGDHDANSISRVLSDRNGKDNSGAFQVGSNSSSISSVFATMGGPAGPTLVGP